MRLGRSKGKDMDIDEYTKKMAELFSRNEWLSPSDKKSLDKLIRFGECINDESKNMIYDLMLKYKKIPWTNYINLLIEIIDNLPLAKFHKIKSFYVLPIIQECDKGKPKSSTTVAYAFKSPEISENIFFENKKMIVNDIKGIPQNINKSSTSNVILVDDFVGTGESALTFLEENEYIKNINKDKIFFIFIAGMQDGIKRIQEKGYTVFCSYIQEKGIDSIPNLNKKQEYILLMEKLETSYSIKENVKFGYGHSEALISLVRTPNNTFPIFWDGKKNIYAPFERK